MRDEEHKLQCACVRWLRYSNPTIAGYLFAIPNGGARDVVTGKRLKDEGVMAGVADLFLSVPNKDYHGLYIEMKTSKGIQSPSQKIFEQRVVKAGYQYIICRTFDEFVKVVEGYLS